MNKIIVKFNTLSGPERLEMDIDEALESEVSSSVKILLANEAITSTVVSHQLYGRVTLIKSEWEGKE